MDYKKNRRFFLGPIQSNTTHENVKVLVVRITAAMGSAKPSPNQTAEVPMDTFFLSHGAPTLCVDETIPERSFFKSWLPTAVTGTARHPRGVGPLGDGHANRQRRPWHQRHHPRLPRLPGPDLTYPAPGAPDVAERTKKLLEDAGFGPVSEDHGRGLDHGTWVPLMLMYPEADVPVCQLSVQTSRDGTYHYNLGKAIAPLRDEGVLVLGSGTATHNLGEMGPDDAPVPQWASGFDTWLKDSLLDGRYDDVKRYKEKAPYGEVAHPSPDHLYPLHVALGAAGDESRAELIHHSWTNASISYASYRFTTKK